MIYLKIPNSLKINTFIENQGRLSLTYKPIHGTRQNKIADYDNDFLRGKIGDGQKDFELAKEKIRQWQMFPSGWTSIIAPDKNIKIGTTVAMFAQFCGIWFRNACQIVEVIDEPNRFGFAYGTLPGHIERGEELFLVEINDQNEVFYTIKAFSKPRHWLAKIGYPIVRLLQEKFRQDSLKEMKI